MVVALQEDSKGSHQKPFGGMRFSTTTAAAQVNFIIIAIGNFSWDNVIVEAAWAIAMLQFTIVTRDFVSFKSSGEPQLDSHQPQQRDKLMMDQLQPSLRPPRSSGSFFCSISNSSSVFSQIELRQICTGWNQLSKLKGRF